jgi:hypothetical protein
LKDIRNEFAKIVMSKSSNNRSSKGKEKEQPKICDNNISMVINKGST